MPPSPVSTVIEILIPNGEEWSVMRNHLDDDTFFGQATRLTMKSLPAIWAIACVLQFAGYFNLTLTPLQHYAVWNDTALTYRNGTYHQVRLRQG